MIVYFSGTGNSRWCAQVLAHLLDDELMDAGQFIRNGIAADLISGKPWVFTAPTYAWQLPKIFLDFIRAGSFSGCKDAYFVMTCGGDVGNAAAYIRPVCQEKELCFRGILPVMMPENYVAMFDVPDEQTCAEILLQARPVLQEASRLIQTGEDLPELSVNVRDKVKSGKIHDIFYKKFVKAGPFYSKDNCISCGKCAERCVLNNIRLENGRPVWGDCCTHCMACICGCPVEAIEYGKKSIGKPRYQCPEFIE